MCVCVCIPILIALDCRKQTKKKNQEMQVEFENTCMQNSKFYHSGYSIYIII